MESVSSKWKMLGSSAAGISHLRCGVPCQDAHGTLRLPNEELMVLAVADGAGSARRAEEGSRLAVAQALEFFERNYWKRIPRNDADWKEFLTDAVLNARLALEDAAGSEDLRELATTLLLAAASAETVAIAKIGDGAIVSRVRYGELQVITPLEDREYANETCFLTGAGLDRELFFRVVAGEEIDAIAVLSDGMQRLAIEYPSNLAYPGFFNPLFAYIAEENAAAEELEAFLTSARVNERTDDDKTLVLAVRNASV